jgi:hypothetical protein
VSELLLLCAAGFVAGFIFAAGWRCGQNVMADQVIKAANIVHPNDPAARVKLMRTLIDIREGHR